MGVPQIIYLNRIFRYNHPFQGTAMAMETSICRQTTTNIMTCWHLLAILLFNTLQMEKT